MKWNLNELFSSKEELNKEIQNIKSSIEFFKENFQNSTFSAQAYIKATENYERILKKISKISTYIYLIFAKDTKQGAFYSFYKDELIKLEEELLFFELSFKELSEEQQREVLAASPTYKYFYEQKMLANKHLLSFKEERILLKTSVLSRDSFVRLFDETLTKLSFDFQGEKIGLEELLSKASHEDREIRKEAVLTLAKTLEEKEELFSYILNMIKKDLALDCELRAYPHPESSMNLYNQIDKKSVDSLIQASQNSFSLVAAYYEEKRKILGYEKLYDYDRYANIFEESSKISFEEAKEIVLAAFKNFDEEFYELALLAFEKNYIDIYPEESKMGGAFSHSGDEHPFVMLNFTNEKRDLFTLAHELGHFIHQSLAKKQSYLNQDSALITAETASVFCEMLVFDFIKKEASQKEKLSLLSGKLEDIFATLYRQITFTSFEREFHDRKEEWTSEEINELWLQHSQAMFGDSLELSKSYKYFWAYISHFVHSPFYCYSYAYAQLLVLALFGLYKEGKVKNFTQLYKEFLSLGGSKAPKEMMELFGLNIEDEKFWNIGIQQIELLLKEFIGENNERTFRK